MMSVTQIQEVKPKKRLKNVTGRICRTCGSTDISVVEDSLLTIQPVKRLECQCGSRDITTPCPECGGYHFEEDTLHANLSCKTCGLVLRGPPPLSVNGQRVDYEFGLSLDDSPPHRQYSGYYEGNDFNR